MKKPKPSRQSRNVEHTSFHVRFSKELYEQLREEAIKKNWSIALLVNEIIKKHFEK